MALFQSKARRHMIDVIKGSIAHYASHFVFMNLCL